MLIDEKKYTLEQAADILNMPRRTFDKTVRPNLRLIVHNKRLIEVPQSSIEEYLNSRVMVGTPTDQAEKAKVAKKKPATKRRAK